MFVFPPVRHGRSSAYWWKVDLPELSARIRPANEQNIIFNWYAKRCNMRYH